MRQYDLIWYDVRWLVRMRRLTMGFIQVFGKSIYFEMFGTENEKTLLYLHGGPGASCLDFHNQAKAIGKTHRVFFIDRTEQEEPSPAAEQTAAGEGSVDGVEKRTRGRYRDPAAPHGLSRVISASSGQPPGCLGSAPPWLKSSTPRSGYRRRTESERWTAPTPGWRQYRRW